MLKRVILLAIVCSIGLIAGCPVQSETMTLLDEEVAAVKISKSKGDEAVDLNAPEVINKLRELNLDPQP